jgi:hypothetical protein
VQQLLGDAWTRRVGTAHHWIFGPLPKNFSISAGQAGRRTAGKRIAVPSDSFHLHTKPFVFEFDHIAGNDFLPLARFDLAVYPDPAFGYRVFGFTATADQIFEFQDFVKLDGLL